MHFQDYYKSDIFVYGVVIFKCIYLSPHNFTCCSNFNLKNAYIRYKIHVFLFQFVPRYVPPHRRSENSYDKKHSSVSQQHPRSTRQYSTTSSPYPKSTQHCSTSPKKHSLSPKRYSISSKRYSTSPPKYSTSYPSFQRYPQYQQHQSPRTTSCPPWKYISSVTVEQHVMQGIRKTFFFMHNVLWHVSNACSKVTKATQYSIMVVLNFRNKRIWTKSLFSHGPDLKHFL